MVCPQRVFTQTVGAVLRRGTHLKTYRLAWRSAGLGRKRRVATPTCVYYVNFVGFSSIRPLIHESGAVSGKPPANPLEPTSGKPLRQPPRGYFFKINHNTSPHFRHNCGDQCGLSRTHDDTNCLRCGPPAPPDGAFATQTAPMRRRVLVHLLIFDTNAAINVVYPAPMTTRIAYAAARQRRPAVYLQHKPRRCVGVF